MPQNALIGQRLADIRQMLLGAHSAGAAMSSASKGSERAAFVDQSLSEVLTPQFRFGDGDATDTKGNRSGQLDVVVEYPWMPSLPVVGADRPRLYLAEGVAAVIEVKSDLASQWTEVCKTSTQLKKLNRVYGGGILAGFCPPPQIPLFAVGYAGWKTMQSVQEHLNEGPVDGILVIESGLFAGSAALGGVQATGEWSLWGLIICLHKITSALSSMGGGVPVNYAV